MKHRLLSIASASLFALTGLFGSCADTEAVEDSAEKSDQTLGTGENDDAAGCPEMSYTALGWTESSQFGTPSDIFGSWAGTCTAPFVLNAADVGLSGLSPSSAESDITVTVTLDTTSAQLGTLAEDAEFDGDCPTESLSVSGTVLFSTADGVFLDSADITLISEEGNIPGQMSVSIPFEEIGGTLTYTPEGNEEATSLGYLFSPLATACAGSVFFSMHESYSNGIASEGIGEIATWSSTGCAAGEEQVDIVETYGDDMAQQISALWNDTTLTGSWDDGTSDTLHLDVSINELIGCRATGTMGISLPATIAYYTDSGILSERTVTPGSFSVSIDDDGTLYHSGLWISDTMECTTGTELDSYSLESCDSLLGITIQLGVQWSKGSTTYSISDEGLMIYEYDSSTSVGLAASNLRSLSLDE